MWHHQRRRKKARPQTLLKKQKAKRKKRKKSKTMLLVRGRQDVPTDRKIKSRVGIVGVGNITFTFGRT